MNVFQAIFATPPFSIAYPSPNPPLIAGTQNVSSFPQNPKDPYSTNWLFGIQQELAPSTVLTVNYTGNKTQHMQAGISFAAINLNPTNPNPNIPARPYSGFANENLDADTLSSNYNALQVQLRRNIGRLNLEGNYTWSHEIDDLVNVFSGLSNPANPNFDRGNGDWDVRHNATGSVVYSLSELKGSNSIMRGVFGGWQASTIVQTRSGGPENIQVVSGFFGLPIRPDSLAQPFACQDLAGRTPATIEQRFSPIQISRERQGQGLGDVGRNALRAPAFFQWDMSAMKNFPVTERVTVQFRADLLQYSEPSQLRKPRHGNLPVRAGGRSKYRTARNVRYTKFINIGNYACAKS